MNDGILNYILHYKKSIERQFDDPQRIHHCLTRLAKLKVNVNHLQVTGIGKTVNSVRKMDGEAGDLAEKLVAVWKEMVDQAEKSEKSKPPVPLFKLPIKLEPEEPDSPPQETHQKKSSSSSSHNSKNSHSKSEHSSRNGHHPSKEDKKSKRSDSIDKKSSQSSESKLSEGKHHKSHRHSKTSHGESSSSKRKHGEEEVSTESKENKSSPKKPKLEPQEIKKESASSSNGSHSKSSSKHREKSSTKSKEKTEKVKSEADEELDGSQGIGFAEALALFDMPSTSKKKDLQLADKIVKVKSPSKLSRDEKKSSGNDSKKSLKALTAPPKLLTQKPKLEPLADIVAELPTDVSIPDYRPMPLNSVVKDYINTSVLGSTSSYFRPQPKMTDRELLTESFSSKANRTRVYSGNRVQRAVPTLFESCIKVLQDNIEFIESTGGVPFHVIRPVLEKAKPEQLSNIEYYNQELLEDTDELWEPHVKRKFRTRQRLEMESWREMYERCTQEDEIKLSRLTKNIKQHQEKTSNGVQKTKMAFVDSIVKPPRGIMRKQEIFGTNRKLVVSPAARTVGLRNIAPNLAAAGDARLRVAAGIRDDAQNVVGRGINRNINKKAPMMAKILSKFRR